MIKDLPIWVEVVFILVFLTTLIFFYCSNGKPTKTMCLVFLWAIIQTVLSISGFYQIQSSFPRFILVLLPVFFVVGYGLLPSQIDWMYKNRNIRVSTFLHVVRIPIELLLFRLYMSEMIPRLMTFEGRNFDIVIGATAPLIGCFLIKNKVTRKQLIVWNVVGFCFVSFIFINAILSAELPIQQFAFDQPNKAMAYFPFILLPAAIVPIVIWTHITDVIVLLKANK